MRKNFRLVSGIKDIGDPWPDPNEARYDPDTQEKLLTPYFDQDVTYSKNQEYIKKVTQLVERELEVKHLHAINN